MAVPAAERPGDDSPAIELPIGPLEGAGQQSVTGSRLHFARDQVAEALRAGAGSCSCRVSRLRQRDIAAVGRIPREHNVGIKVVPLAMPPQELTSPPPDTSGHRRSLRWVGEVAVVVLVVLAVQWWQGRDAPSGAAPAFAGPTADGDAMSLDGWRAAHPGEAVALYFWAEWCPICRMQEGNIATLRDGHPVLTVATRSGSPGQVAAVLQARGMNGPVVIDADGDIAARYGLHGVPALVVVDPGGELRSVAVGYTTTAGMWLRLWLAGLRG
ncbi:MAG: redoxin domain-containing protein [Burkholderiales bacterium]